MTVTDWIILILDVGTYDNHSMKIIVNKLIFLQVVRGMEGAAPEEFFRLPYLLSGYNFSPASGVLPESYVS